MDTALDLMDRDSFVRWAFTHYLNVAPPTFARAGSSPTDVQPWTAPAQRPAAPQPTVSPAVASAAA